MGGIIGTQAIQRRAWGRVRLAGAMAAVAILVLANGPGAVGQAPSSEQRLPDQLFDVPANIPDIADEPLHEPVAVVYQGTVRTGLFDEEQVPIVVGTETGQVRSVRAAGERGHAVPSPDGTKLALTHFRVVDAPSSGLVMLDVVGDRTKTYELPDEGFGTGVSDVVWAPDGTEVMLTAEVTTEISRGDNDMASAARLVPGSLDLATGRWKEHDDWTHAVSQDGRRLIGRGYGEEYVVEMPDTEPVSLSLGETRDAMLRHREGLAFSPDGGQVAALTSGSNASGQAYGYSLEAYDSSTGARVERVELGDYRNAQLIGWGERGIVVQTTSDTGVWVGRVGIMGDEPTTTTLFTLTADYYQGEIEIPAAMLDADTRDAEPPDAPFDWLAWIPDPFILLILGVVGLVIAIDVLIRRVRSVRGSATAPGSIDH